MDLILSIIVDGINTLTGLPVWSLVCLETNPCP